MTKEIDMSNPWATNSAINIDDGGGTSFSSGYDTLTFTLTPRVGYWNINDSFQVHVIKRPNRLNRVMTKFLLGWDWVDS
jgi:hypothetical protein